MKADTATVPRKVPKAATASTVAAPPDGAVVAAEAESCATCRYFLARQFHHAAERLGQCRRHAAGPIVQASSWCGDWEEERLLMDCSSLQGTRESRNFFRSRPSSRITNGRHSRDLGLSKRVVASATFSGSVISDAASNFAVFKVGDRITISGTAGGQNNGDRTILGVTATTLTVDFPVKGEGPTAGVEIRTP